MAIDRYSKIRYLALAWLELIFTLFRTAVKWKDLYERKARMIKEEEEEKRMEMEILVFKSRKKTIKRKPDEENPTTCQQNPKKPRLEVQESSREGADDVHGVGSEGEEYVQGVVEGREDVADPPEKDVGKGSSRKGGDQAQDSKRKTSSQEAGKARLSEVRKRMEIERKSKKRRLQQAG